ncbi:MAG: hypothetical protein ACLFR0_06960 [Alphaproteobacteria bacterium]
MEETSPMVSPPLERNFDPHKLPDVILKDPGTPEQFSHIPVGPEDVENEINKHIAHHIESAESAKRSAVYETVSNSPVIASALMGDFQAFLLFAKTWPVYYEFYRGYDEGNDYARRLVRAKRVDNAYREIHGRSDARIYHALGLELSSDPELLNKPIDEAREKLIEDSIRIVPPLSTRLHKVKNNLQEAATKLARNPRATLCESAKSLHEKVSSSLNGLRTHDYSKAGKAFTDFDYKGAVMGFAKGCRDDVLHLLPLEAHKDLMSIKKRDIKEMNLKNIGDCFHARHWGIAGTFTAASYIVAHQTVEHVMMPPVQYLYNRYAKAHVQNAADKLAYKLSPVKNKITKLSEFCREKFSFAKPSQDPSVEEKSADISEDSEDDDFKIRSKPVTTPTNLHRLDREYQRIMRARKENLTSSFFNTAALIGESYFVYGVTKDAIYTAQDADSVGDYGKAFFYGISAVLATAANNHICSRRVDLFNQLQSDRSKAAQKDAEKISIENKIRIIRENIEKNITNEDPEVWFGDVIETLTLLSKVERRSFRREERAHIRDYLIEISEDLPLYDAALGDDGLKLKKIEELLHELDDNYLKELPSLKNHQDQIEQNTPDIAPE